MNHNMAWKATSKFTFIPEGPYSMMVSLTLSHKEIILYLSVRHLQEQVATSLAAGFRRRPVYCIIGLD
jgi:hypothetical protein